jgi:Ca2+/H+ antiporter
MLQNEKIPFCTRCVYVRVLISVLFSVLFPVVNSRKLFEIHVVILRINQIALSICVALSFRTHIEQLNCIMGTQTCRTDCVVN